MVMSSCSFTTGCPLGATPAVCLNGLSTLPCDRRGPASVLAQATEVLGHRVTVGLGHFIGRRRPDVAGLVAVAARLQADFQLLDQGQHRPVFLGEQGVVAIHARVLELADHVIQLGQFLGVQLELAEGLARLTRELVDVLVEVLRQLDGAEGEVLDATVPAALPAVATEASTPVAASLSGLTLLARLAGLTLLSLLPLLALLSLLTLLPLLSLLLAALGQLLQLG